MEFKKNKCGILTFSITSWLFLTSGSIIIDIYPKMARAYLVIAIFTLTITIIGIWTTDNI